MTKPLSPAAQAVYEAAIEQSEYPNDAEWVVINALRAAADHLPSSAMYPSCDWGSGWRTGIKDARQTLLDIAAELEGSSGKDF